MSLKMQVRKLYDYPSRWGDRLGWEWLIYNPGVYLEFGMVARRNAPLFGCALLECFPDAGSFADVGCGTGYFAAFLARQGRRVIGFEYSIISRAWARFLRVNVHPFDLARPASSHAGAGVDLAFSLEVGEHIPSAYASRFVDFLCDAAPTVVLTCAGPGQTGNGHINCQPKEYWRALFRSREFDAWPAKEEQMVSVLARCERLSPFLRDNLMVFRKRHTAK